jgi:hypothetical protein
MSLRDLYYLIAASVRGQKGLRIKLR